MIKRMILMLFAVTVILGGILGFKYMMAMGTKKFLSSMPVPAQTVSTTKADMEDWQKTIDAVGTARAVNGADVSSEEPGIIDSLSFKSGDDVAAGTVLAHLRDDDDIAKLKALQATEKLAEITLARDQKQLKAQAISQATVDTDVATLNSDKAQVDEQQAVIDKKTIRAPFAGHLGIRQVDIGQYLAAGTAIVTLQQLDPIYVDFNLPEQDLAQIADGQKVAARIDAAPGVSFDGTIDAANAKIDEATRNVQVRASFTNPDHKLLPGMFAHVAINVGAPQKLVTLPATAVTYNPYGDTVFVVDKDKDGKLIAKQILVTPGDTRGDQVSILSGVTAGDEVVTSGQLKLRNGAPVKVDNEIQPLNDANPTVKDQ